MLLSKENEYKNRLFKLNYRTEYRQYLTNVNQKVELVYQLDDLQWDMKRYPRICS